MLQVMAEKEAARQEREGGGFDPLTSEERAEENRKELQVLMDNIAGFNPKARTKKEPTPETDNEHNWQLASEGSVSEDGVAGEESEDQDTQTQHKSYFHLLQKGKGTRPKIHKPNDFEKLQIAMRDANKRNKEQRRYFEEEQGMLRQKVRLRFLYTQKSLEYFQKSPINNASKALNICIYEEEQGMLWQKVRHLFVYIHKEPRILSKEPYKCAKRAL